MKSIAISLGKHGITANAVLPGTVITDINYDQLEIENTELKDYFIERTPLNRLAEPNDIAAAMVFFASDDANAITGATLVVDGGMEGRGAAGGSDLSHAELALWACGSCSSFPA